MRMLWSLLLVIGITGVASCNQDTKTTVTPAGRGARGETCEARNDCGGGLACVSGTCSKNDFDISVSAKHCDRVECEDDKDCCGDRPREAPAKCANRNSICLTPTLGDCTTVSCTTDSQCGSGACPPGTCSLGGSCESDADCEPDVCDIATYSCTISGAYCTGDEDCYGELTCGGYRVCNCANPDFDPSDPICSDPDCEDVCTLRCDDELCVPDTSCEDDDDCIGSVSDICEDGRCVECTENDDCSGEEECVNNFCEEPCTENEECPLFHACEDGECVERGCGSDTECILAASRAGGGEDPRLYQCLEAGGGSDTHICKLPCENDAGCASFEVCDDGFCVFIGCKTDEECRAYFGIENEETDDAKPYITKAVCRE